MVYWRINKNYITEFSDFLVRSNILSEQVDLTKRRVVDEGEGRLWAESRGFHYFETSAQSGEGINEMFQVSAGMHTRSKKFQF